MKLSLTDFEKVNLAHVIQREFNVHHWAAKWCTKALVNLVELGFQDKEFTPQEFSDYLSGFYYYHEIEEINFATSNDFELWVINVDEIQSACEEYAEIIDTKDWGMGQIHGRNIAAEEIQLARRICVENFISEFDDNVKECQKLFEAITKGSK